MVASSCVEFIRAQGRADRKQVGVYVRSQKFDQALDAIFSGNKAPGSTTKIDFSDEDIFRILETQVYDGKIEPVEDETSAGTGLVPNKTYIATTWYVPKMVFSLLERS